MKNQIYNHFNVQASCNICGQICYSKDISDPAELLEKQYIFTSNMREHHNKFHLNKKGG